MAKPRRLKRDIDMAKRDKAARKRERRQRTDEGEPEEGGEAVAGSDTAAVPTGASQAELLEALSVLHARFEAGDIGLDEFETVKADLLARVAVA